MRKRGMIIVLWVFTLLFLVRQIEATEDDKISLVYLYGAKDEGSLLEQLPGAVNTISPSYFDLNEEGDLIINPINTQSLQKLQKQHIKVTPFLSNHWDRKKGRAALKNREQLVEHLVLAIGENHLDGIQIDLENLTEQDRAEYVLLLKKLRQELPKEKTISVAIAANPQGLQSGWQGSYDIQSLAQYADYLVLMAYDEHYEGGSSGPVASIEFVEKSITYALSKVDASKLVLGVPFYGRYWKTGEEVGGYGITLKQIQNVLSKYEACCQYDAKRICMTATAYIKEGEESMVINGRKLTEGTYQFYYENEESISQKMALVNKYQLKGLAAWSLGQETKEVWQEYARFLSNLPEEKEEIQEAHWAKDAIDYVQEKGWMLGRENHVFAPNAYLTRAELTMIMTRILCLQVDNMLEEIGYLDVSLHWARNAINAVTKTGLMEGYENGYFYPEKIITREEVAKVLSFLVKEQKIEKNIVFTDVKQERWSYSYIQKMVKNGIFNGYEDDTFRPQQGITRAEMAMLLMRLNLEEV